MDIESIVGEVRASVLAQLALAGDEPTVLATGEAVLAALGPALRQTGSVLAEQAAAEVGAQLPDRTVDVVLVDGQPSLVVRSSDLAEPVNTDHLDARLTVRIPEELKGDLEEAASAVGDSMNTFVVKALAGHTNVRKRAFRSTFEGTIET